METFEEQQQAPCVITLKTRGPVAITGNFIVIDEEGNEMPKKEKVSLCRCGMSKTLPICDGAHKGLSF
jgi:CDGSH-type Zn-finger protein